MLIWRCNITFAANPSRFGVARARERARAFSLIEVALAVVIIALGLVAVMRLVTTTTQVADSNTTDLLAVQYARAGWEMAYGQGFDKVKTWTANPPTALPAYSQPAPGYERRIWAENISIDNIAQSPGPGGAIGKTLRLNVEVYKGGKRVHTQQWIVTSP